MKNIVLFISLLCGISAFAQVDDVEIPYSATEDHLTVWNGKEYVPFFVKGVNLGIAVPGTYPGELAASREQYSRWFTQIKEAGFNCIRLYTLHYPHFYEILDSFNLANQHNPLLFFQGVWLNEELEGYEEDLYFLTDTFKVEIEENIDCVHGNRDIPHRYGKAYGKYTVDASKWNIGYIIGREIYPAEVLHTNEQNSKTTSFSGEHFSVENTSATNAWVASNLDHLVQYEKKHYKTQRPVSLSSWPTLDPIIHHEEDNRDEDTASIDLADIKLLNAPAGFFISYHAYPYYPDFVSEQSSYKEFSDSYGPNSYLGYLHELKAHYKKFPVIIAEYGVPSSWGVAHYTSSGMNHGGFDETEQGNADIRLLHTIQDANCGGGLQFAWIDEWFKRTWVTDPIDYESSKRILWHNVTAAEQNYGLVGFSKESSPEVIGVFNSSDVIASINADANYDFFTLEIGLNKPLDVVDELWVALDTYDENLGESLLPTDDELPYRSEFALYITNYSAALYVTQAYDLFGIWHKIAGEEQKFQSTVSDGDMWNIVRWKNNSDYNAVQYIGKLQTNSEIQPPSSMDAVVVYEDKIQIKLPWSLINFVDPSSMKVFHDDRSTPNPEDRVSDGIAVSVQYDDVFYNSSKRFVWDTWDIVKPSDVTEYFKDSYWVMKDRLNEFNNKAVAVVDFYDFTDKQEIEVSEENGLIANDFDMDGTDLQVVLTSTPSNGDIDINPDGSFIYTPDEGFVGTDRFEYALFDGNSLSAENTVTLSNNGFVVDNTEILHEKYLLTVAPNHADKFVKISANSTISKLIIFDGSGKMVDTCHVDKKSVRISVKEFAEDDYYIVAFVEGKTLYQRFIVDH